MDINEIYVPSVRVNNFVMMQAPKFNLFSAISIYGKKKTGKTVFIRYLLDAMKGYYPWAWCFTKTKINLTYQRNMPEKFIFENYSNEILKLIVNRQLEARKVFMKHPDSFNPRAILIWDDCLGKELLWNQYINAYYYISRHLLNLNIMSAQHVFATPPAIRTNTDYGVLFNTDYASAIEELWKDFACKMPKNMWLSIMDNYTKDYGFIVVDNDPNVPYDMKFFAGRAEIIEEEFVLGCEEYWKGSDEQLRNIFSGQMKRHIEETSELNDVDSHRTQLLLKRAKTELTGNGSSMIRRNILG